MKKSEITGQGLDNVGFIGFENRPITSGPDHINENGLKRDSRRGWAQDGD
jgi:hypothetical protein